MLLRLTLVGGLALVGLTLATVSAEARWYCRASSPTGSWGWGSHNYSEPYARQRALRECAVRTPRGYYCRLQYCNYTQRRPY